MEGRNLRENADILLVFASLICWMWQSNSTEVIDFLENKGLGKYAEKIIEVTDVSWFKFCS